MKRYTTYFATLLVFATAISTAFAVPVLPGDYDSNGTVDSADYAIWGNGNTPLTNEVFGVTTGTNTIDDYNAWRARFGSKLVYWDIDGATAGAGGGGAPSGTWDTTNTFWSTDAIFGATAGSAWTAGDAAAFAASNDATGTYTVTVSGTQTVSAMTFEEGAVTLSGGTVNLTSSVVQVDSGGASATINSVIGGSSGLAKTGAGTLSLGGANTYTGATTLTSVGVGTPNTLKTLAANTLPSTTVLTLPATNGNAKVELYDASNVYYNQTIAGLSGGGSGTATPTVVDVGKATLTIDVPAGPGAVYNGYLKTDFTSPTDRGMVIKKGAGDLTLGGLNNNFAQSLGFGGEFVLEAGRLIYTNNVGTGAADTAKPSHLTLKGGTVVKNLPDPASSMSVTPRTLEIAGSFSFDMNSSTGNAQFLVNTAASGTGDNIVGGINLTVNNPTITVNNGVIAPNAANPTGFTPTFILSGIVLDGGAGYGFTKAGPGTMTLDRVNTYTGTTTVAEGVLRVTAATGSANTLQSTIGNGSSPIVLSGGTLEYTGALINSVRVGKIDNPVTMTSSSTISHNTGSGANGLSPKVDFLFSNFTATSGTLTLLNNGSSNEPNLVPGPYNLNPVEFRVGFTGTGFDFAQPVVITNHTNVNVPNRTTSLMSANTTGTHTFSGVVSGNGGYVRDGAGGTSVLSGSNTYANGTKILAGTLLVNNTSGSGTGTGAITIESGGTLGGTGALTGAVTLNTGGTIAPGTSIQSLDVGSLTANGGLFSFELGAPGSPGVTSDLLNVTASNGLTLTSGTVSLTDFGGLAAGTYTLIDYAGTLGGAVANLGTPSGPGSFNYLLQNNGTATTIELVVTAAAGEFAGVPEPGSMLLALIGVGSTLVSFNGRSRRRRS